MPAYSRDGSTEISWASQKRYISLYVLRSDVLDAHRRRLAHLSVGKGCIRYRSPEAVDFAVVRSILAAVAPSRGPLCLNGHRRRLLGSLPMAGARTLFASQLRDFSAPHKLQSCQSMICLPSIMMR